jgi:hypothetical protein
MSSSSGEITSDDGDVVGTVQRTSFATGTDYSFGNPDVRINFGTQGTLPTQVDVTLSKLPPPTFPHTMTAVSRFYNISQSGGSGFVATLRLAYEHSELNDNEEDDLTLWRYDADRGTWVDEGKDGNDPDANYVYKNNVTDFSLWTLAPVAPTAVDLANFTANSEDRHVRVEWATVWEDNNLGFNLYRNTSAEFPEAAEVLNPTLIPAQAPGSGTGSLYAYDDDDVVSGTTYYYWLEDMDVGGHETLHGPISIDYEPEMIPTSVSMNHFESQNSSTLLWFVMLTVFGVTIGVLRIAYSVLRRPST